MGRCTRAILWMLIILELYVLMLIASYIWFNIVFYVSEDRWVRWDFPSPFFLWRTPIATWAGFAYILSLGVFAGVIAAVIYREISVCREYRRRA